MDCAFTMSVTWRRSQVDDWQGGNIEMTADSSTSCDVISFRRPTPLIASDQHCASTTDTAVSVLLGDGNFTK